MSWLCAAENSSASRISRRKTRSRFLLGTSIPDYGLARDRRLDSHRGGSESHREVVGEIDNLADLDSRSGLEFVHRDDRARLHFDHAPLDAEVREFLLEHPRAALELAFVHLRMLGWRQIEQRLRRKFERTLLPRLGRGRLVALLANIEQPDLQRRRLAVDALRIRLDFVALAQRERDSRAVCQVELITTRANPAGDSREQLGRRPFQHQGQPADEPERDDDQASRDVDRIVEQCGDARADLAPHLGVVQIPQRAGRRECENQKRAAGNLARDRQHSRAGPYALRQPRDQYHRGVRLVSNQTGERRRDRRTDRTAEVGTPPDIDAYEADRAERGERQQRERT